ncbi:UDP-N-acetylglucosamine 1-carboxyvinyltransferase [Candidatus Gottesmanbacteria bacterium RBG_16_37_8]|uniref:UDP-N-acetylglucosamine 1-carboxyvinyltransferase n=1 Tax=Candidatus Gottesmanbacteria bacterium RBG_16_37_8 TaxID=1798371 RepID=A0A1F5YSH2_9BACT|nr:MAG: UDP-N-acetylglucosamine 1-carboxyvinyltransferase [Candidatus Gottesmanbacteria bacterium RBG_16_37_8]
MERFLVSGGRKIRGEINVSGAKNVAMKVILTGLLTEKPVYVRNIPLISSVTGTADLVRNLGVKVDINDNHTMKIQGNGLNKYTIPLDMGGLYRTATMVLGPLLQRFGKAIVPNPGGCRLGQRPVDWHIEGLKKMGAKIKYDDGFFHATSSKLKGIRFTFSKNTHTGTETLLLAAVLSQGETVLENASQEPEVDDLIKILCLMGAKIKRVKGRTIVINGVKKLSGTEFTIMPDRNEVVTFAIGAIVSGGNILIKGAQRSNLTVFLKSLDKIGTPYQVIDENHIRFSSLKKIKPTHIITKPHPGFMTDWQAPWALLMSQAGGVSTIHESIFEDRFNYVGQLKKMGAKIESYHPKVKDPRTFYNFNWTRRFHCQAIRITGKTDLHDAVLEVADLRAGATLILAALIAQGNSVIYGINHIDRGYEKIESRLGKLGIPIKRLKN